MSEEEKIVEKIATLAQDCFHQHPVVILGSGASVVHDLRGMGDLAQYLCDHIQLEDGEETDAWLLIRTALADGDGLEEALLKNTAPMSLVAKIVALTWQAIAEDDLAVMERTARGEEHFDLADLLRGLFKSTHMVTNIVTPNYDRIAEYASDVAGYFHATGFVPGIIRAREGADAISVRRGGQAARAVRIWKVHGSLDWFADAAGRVVSLPISNVLPEGFEPLIVTPGVSKYERTHDEPFRSAIQGADRALEHAASFLCVGYGFRDRHIQPKIVDRCRWQNVPIVILARTLTPETKNFLAENAGQAYLALERDGDGTRAFLPEHPEGVHIERPDLWSFDSFNKMVM
ncbi:SIR2 family protein [Roseibium marinum]|uniref:SIR2-like protein n=1 Tax=Roseibium marinum TaxID=281252 RepID=A0A2S3UJ85_9HYPH|nr:SIR2 family protein [Roseibium marinum]POF27764.1 SIR2-like protein [Roseibium marinum]